MSTKHTIGQFMTRHPQTIGVDQALALAQRMMRKNAVRHLPVLAAGHIVGVISERDLAIAELGRRLDLERTTVDHAMCAAPYCVAPEAPLAEVVREMALRRHEAAVVVDEAGEVVGIFTSVDALLALAFVLAPPARAQAGMTAH